MYGLRWFLSVVFLEFRVLAVPLLGANQDIWGDPSSASSSAESNGIELFGNNSRLPRVLNFFPVPIEEECLSKDGRRRGICMNVYECRIQEGKSNGKCALGFGVCCVFTATCGQEIANNLTYFVSPDFPDYTESMTSCDLTVKKIDDEIAQLRLDFVHFNLGQPNRRTGNCEEDVFVMNGENAPALSLCGLNNGQHVYYDVEETNQPIKITMTLQRKAVSRLWEVIVTQIPFTQRAPIGCLQYHTGRRGTLQTMNYADNGRHLADQDYNICVRQEAGMCSIAYEPCHENSFRISPNNNGTRNTTTLDDDDGIEGSGFAQPRQSEAECVDRVVLPCDNEDLIMMGGSGPGSCNVIHCGDSFCPAGESPCRIESSATPFTVGVHFEGHARDAAPDDNLGMCLGYEQLPCN